MQHWYKDEKYSTRVKDQEGCPAFSLVNKATGEALKHSIGASHPVRSFFYSFIAECFFFFDVTVLDNCFAGFWDYRVQIASWLNDFNVQPNWGSAPVDEDWTD